MTARTYASNVSGPSITGTAPEDPGQLPGDDLTVNDNVFVFTTVPGGNITFSAGDNVVILGTVDASGSGTLSITAGDGDNDRIGAIIIDGEASGGTVLLDALQGISLTDGQVLAFTTVDLHAGAGVSQSGGAVLTPRLESTTGVTGNVSLARATNEIEALGTFTVTSGDFTLVDNVATLTLDGDVSADHVSITNIAAGSVIAHASGTVSGQTIELIADELQLASGAITASDTIFLAPATADTGVSFGDAVASPFSIDEADLLTLSAPTLTIGRNAAGTITAGPIKIGGAVVASSILNLASRGSVTLDVGTVQSLSNAVLQVGAGVGTLNVTAGDTVRLGTGATGLDVGAVGGTTTSGHFVAIGVAAHPMAANAIMTAGGEIVVQSGAGLTIAGALTSQGGNVLARGDGLGINADIDAGSGAIGLQARNGDINQTGGKLSGHNLLIDNATSFGSIDLERPDNAITGHVVLHTGPAGGGINFTNTSAYTIGGEGIFYSSLGIALAAPTDGAIVTGPGSGVSLSAGGDISQAGGQEDRIVTPVLVLIRLGAANPNVVLDNPHNAVGALQADLGSGALTLVDASDLAIDTVTAGTLAITTSLVTISNHITTQGAQTYHGALALGAASAFLESGGDVTVDGAIQNRGFDLIMNVGGNGTFGGVISGTGGFIKDGVGTVTFGLAETYGGDTFVNGGTLRVDGSIASPLVTVQNGGTLGGHGTVGDVHVASGGTLAPGDSQNTSSLGVLTSGDVTLAAGAHLSMELGGTTAGLYDQLQVHGAVSLGGATLDGTLVNGFAPTIGNSFLLIDNDGTDAVNGTFLGLAEGARLAIGGASFAISYQGGDGNDVTLTAVQPLPPPPPPVQPVIGTAGDDSFTAPAGDSAFIGGRGVDSITFNFKLTDATVTHSGNDIVIDGPNGASHTVVSGIETFIFADGTVNTRDGNPLVDDLFYYVHNHDVWNAHVDADTHFAQFGWREGRDPNAWFDTKGYLSQYADVKAAGVNPLTHYDQFGWREGRDPSTAFDSGDYLSHNGDVAAAHVDPLAHFLAWAGEEGRTPFNDGVWG